MNNFNKQFPEILSGYFNNGYELSSEKCNELSKFVSGLEIEIYNLKNEIASAPVHIAAKDTAENKRLTADMARELLEMRGKPEHTCEWVQDCDGCWETSCGEYFFFEDGGLEENHCTYCHHCGKKITAKLFDDSEGEDE